MLQNTNILVWFSLCSQGCDILIISIASSYKYEWGDKEGCEIMINVIRKITAFIKIIEVLLNNSFTDLKVSAEDSLIMVLPVT